jgi:hypothetical protein
MIIRAIKSSAHTELSSLEKKRKMGKKGYEDQLTDV